MATSADLFEQAARLHQSGNLAQAEPLYRQILQADPTNGSACFFLGVLLSMRGLNAEATAWLRQALHLDPNNTNIHVYLGNALLGQKDLAAASGHFRQALRFQPDHAVAHNMLGITLAGQNKLAEAGACFREALRLNPNYVEATVNLGNTLAGLGQTSDAAECYRQTLRLDPNNRIALWNQARLHLLQGEFEKGWANYELRWMQPGKVKRSFPQPLWDGSHLDGKTLFVFADGGLGDSIQFARYLPLIQDRGGRVVFECQPALVKLMTGVKGADRAIPAGMPCSDFDVQIPLLSLPGVFRTDSNNIPATVPYLDVDMESSARWRQEVPAFAGDTQLKVGVVWEGGLSVPGDLRSIPLTHFEILSRIPGVRLFSLQVGPGTNQLSQVSFPITDLGSKFNLDSLDDLAAAIMNMDLVVTIDTAAAHLAGALGKPVWVALSVASCWRWLLERGDSPWYPTMRLYRQRNVHDWNDVFERTANDLRLFKRKR
jgi:Tfp pilus assembly protein PilF